MPTQRTTTSHQRPSPKLAENSAAFLLNQYLALRDEIIKRMEIQNQIISLMLIAGGTFISLGIERQSTTLILATPVLALFLASFWTNHDVRVRHIGLYIRRYIEEKFLDVNTGWEGVGGTSGTKYLSRHLSIFASQGIFIGIQLLSIFAALITTKFSLEDQILFAVDTIFVLITIPLMWRRRVVV